MNSDIDAKQAIDPALAQTRGVYVPTLREARVVCPIASAYSRPQARDRIEDSIVTRFGGFTKTYANGAWRNPDNGEIVSEPVIVYDVAVSDDPTAAKDLIAVAQQIKREFAQECVYLRFPDGEVHFI